MKNSIDNAKKETNIINRRKPSMGQGQMNGIKLGNDGIYRFRIVIHGKQKTGSLDTTRFTEAEKKLAIIKAELLQEDKGKKKAPTFEKAVEIWKQNKVGHVTDRYIKIGYNAFKRHFIPSIGTRFIDAITVGDLKQCMQQYIIKTQANKNIKNMGGHNQLLTYLHSLFLEMKECGYVKSYEDLIPAFAKSQTTPKRVIQEEDFQKVLEVVDRFRPEIGIGVRMSLFLGLRSVEVPRAKWACIDWKSKEFRNLDTKGKESEAIPICDEMFDAFLKLKQEAESKGKSVNPSDPILPALVPVKYPEHYYKHVLKKAGIEALGHPLSSHDLRRSFITTLSKHGVPLETIRRLARHSDITTTAKYIQVQQNEKTAAIHGVFNKPKAGKIQVKTVINPIQVIDNKNTYEVSPPSPSSRLIRFLRGAL